MGYTKNRPGSGVARRRSNRLRTLGSPDDLIGRVASLAVSGEGANLAEYLYMGVASRVQTYYPTPDARMRLFGSAGSGDPYTSLDRFGRLTEVLWEDASASARSTKFDYGYDRASNRTWRENLVLTSGEDEHYGYDGLYQVSGRQRGDLDAGKTGMAGTPEREEEFAYDPSNGCPARPGRDLRALTSAFLRMGLPLARRGSGRTTRRESTGRRRSTSPRPNRLNETTRISGSGALVAIDPVSQMTTRPPERLPATGRRRSP
ncbi:MAG: hypothetical protein R3F11_23040 [Verrucomicrobiales bacterium]